MEDYIQDEYCHTTGYSGYNKWINGDFSDDFRVISYVDCNGVEHFVSSIHYQLRSISSCGSAGAGGAPAYRGACFRGLDSTPTPIPQPDPTPTPISNISLNGNKIQSGFSLTHSAIPSLSENGNTLAIAYAENQVLKVFDINESNEWVQRGTDITIESSLMSVKRFLKKN